MLFLFQYFLFFALVVIPIPFVATVPIYTELILWDFSLFYPYCLPTIFVCYEHLFRAAY